MSADAMVTTLKSMKLHGMAGAIAALSEQGSPAFKQSGELLDKLIIETWGFEYVWLSW